MSAKYRSGFEYFTEVFSKEYKVDKSILAGAAREVWENELTDEDRASWEEMARLSEQEESEEEKKAADAKKAEEERKAAEAKKAEEERKAAEAKKAEEEKKAADAKKAEEERKAAEAKKAEEERKAAEAKKAEEEKKAADAKKAEEERKAAEAKKAEEERKAAEAKKAEEEKKAADAKKAEEERKAAEAKKAEEERKAAEAKKAEEEKKAADAKKAEEERKAAEAKKAEEERKAAEAKKAEEEKKAAEAKKAEEERKAAEAKKAEEERKAAEAKKAEEEKKAAEAKQAEKDLSSSNAPISGAIAGMLSSPDTSQKISMGTPIGVTEAPGMESEKPQEPTPTKTTEAPMPHPTSPNMDLDRLKQAIGKRVSHKEEEPADNAPTTHGNNAAPAPGQAFGQDQQFDGFRDDMLSNTGFFTSSGPIKSGLTISANTPRQVAKEAPVERTSGGYSPDESIPEVKDPSAVSLDAPSAAVMRQKLMERADELADAVISRALEGDVQALTLCIERVLAPADEYRLQIELPPLDSQEHILEASEAVVRAVSLGELDPQQAKTLHELIEAHWRILEGSELSMRVHQLEKKGGGNNKRQKITLGAFDKPF